MFIPRSAWTKSVCRWHPSRPTNAADRAGVDHLILAFAKSNDTANYKPHVDIKTLKSEYPEAKIMVAIGGWGDTKGFSEAVKSDAGISKFASDVKTMVDKNGLDGVGKSTRDPFSLQVLTSLDIDWEYPGGNGADYKETPNSAKANEIECYPKLLAAIRKAIGKEKVLSIAVPGKIGDMLAYTEETGSAIWPSIDFVNVMSYDLMNRRDSKTAHHTSIEGSKKSVEDYVSIGCPPEKLNLGFAYYAKYFTTAGDCGSHPLGCAIAPAEKADGTDALNSGAFTFEKANMMSVDNATMQISNDGTCGPEKGKCASGCCSQYGNCGTTPEHCNVACQFAFGTGCQGPDIAGSWQKALVEGKTDEKEGGQYYYDAQSKLFWTWDTLDIVDRKYTEIVKGMGLGGVMAWSLGEDSYDWSHVKKLGQLSSGKGGGYGTAPPPAPPVTSLPAQPPSPPPASTTTPAGYAAQPSAQPPAQQEGYNVVPVDGNSEEVEGDDYTYEETCTRRRVKKRSASPLSHVHRKRGHVGSAFHA
jgi:chitinase